MRRRRHACAASVWLLFVCRIVIGLEPTAIDWRFGPVMPVAKSCRGTAVAGTMIVTVGGTLWETGPAETKTKRWLPCVYGFDTGRREWVKLADYPAPAGYPFAAAVGRKVYACGGRSAAKGNRETFILDLAQAAPAWKPGPPLPQPRWGHVGGTIGTTIYVTAGVAGDPGQENGTQRADSILALDTENLEAGWQRVGTMPNTETAWVSGAACAGRLFLFCEATNQAFAFDPNTQQCREITAPPVPLSSGAAATVGDRYVLVSGGTAQAVDAAATTDGNDRNYIANDCFLYDVAQDRYRALTPLRQAVLDQGLVCLGGVIYSFGGEDSPYRSRTDLLQIGRLR